MTACQVHNQVMGSVATESEKEDGIIEWGSPRTNDWEDDYADWCDDDDDDDDDDDWYDDDDDDSWDDDDEEDD